MEKYKFVLGINEEGKYYWAFMTIENEILCITEGYDKKQEAMTAIGILKKFSASSEVYDLTQEE